MISSYNPETKTITAQLTNEEEAMITAAGYDINAKLAAVTTAFTNNIETALTVNPTFVNLLISSLK